MTVRPSYCNKFMNGLTQQHSLSLTAKHNKRKNTGLLYEFFVRYLGRAVIDGRDEDIQKAKSLLRVHFNESTEMGKELALFKALTPSDPITPEQAARLVTYVRETAKNQSQTRLDVEKTSLVYEITLPNKLPRSDGFFNQQVPNYKQLATIQLLLNTWRNSGNGGVLKESVISETVTLEMKLIGQLCQSQSPDATNGSTKPIPVDTKSTLQDVDNLVVSIMAEKFNSKFSGVLTPEQKEIVRLYAFADSSDSLSRQLLVERLRGLEVRCKAKLPVAISEANQSGDVVLAEKLSQIDQVLNDGSVFVTDVELSNNESDNSAPSVVSEGVLEFYLGLSKLETEMMAPTQ